MQQLNTSQINATVETGMSLVLACDAGYAMPLATTLRSLVEHNTGHHPIAIYVLVDSFPEELCRRVSASLPSPGRAINWIPIDLNAFSEFSTMPGVSKMTYARLLIPQVLPEQISRVLYLDTDILVLRDLWPLWKQELGDAVVGAVRDGVDNLLQAKSDRVAKVPAVKSYFNAGVLLMDLARWRADGVSERALAYLKQFPDSLFGDQDALNVACDDKWKSLDLRWNFQGHLKQRIADLPPDDIPGIVHFITNGKPWKASSLSANASLYESFRSRTQFARSAWEKIADVVVKNAMRLHNLLSRASAWRFVWRHAKRWARWRLVAPSPGSGPAPQTWDGPKHTG
jgi:lipopolysaccharide biosynthesis glycosyltransferase